MGVITKISLMKKNKSRVNLFIDDEFYCGLDLFTQQKHRLCVGMEVTETELADVIFDSECASAFEKAAGYINIRRRSEQEVRTYLTQKAYSDAVIDQTLCKLSEYGLVDDAQFCEQYIASYRARWGTKRIEFELKKLGIASEITAEYLADLDQCDDAYRLAVRYRGTKKEVDRQKLYAHLAQKGFEADTIRQAMQRLLDGEE